MEGFEKRRTRHGVIVKRARPQAPKRSIAIDAVNDSKQSAGYAHEFAGTQTVRYAGTSIHTALDASRAFVTAGASAEIARAHAVSLEYQYQKGCNVASAYLVNLGYRYAF